MKLVVQVKLLPSADQAEAMRATLHAANDAANRVSKVAHDKRVFRNFALRKHTYEDIRAAGLGSQAAQHVVKKVADAYRALHSNIKNGNYGKPDSKRRLKVQSKPIAYHPVRHSHTTSATCPSPSMRGRSHCGLWRGG